LTVKSDDEKGSLRTPNVSAKIDIALTDDDNPNHVLISVDSECRMKLTFEEARFLAIRIITAANQAEVRSFLKGAKGKPPPATNAAAKPGWFLQALAR
jgi:hypothetical protein